MSSVIERLQWFFEDLRDAFDSNAVQVKQLHTEKHVCVDCGESVKVAKSKRCPPCGARYAAKVRMENDKK